MEGEPLPGEDDEWLDPPAQESKRGRCSTLLLHLLLSGLVGGCAGGLIGGMRGQRQPSNVFAARYTSTTRHPQAQFPSPPPAPPLRPPLLPTPRPPPLPSPPTLPAAPTQPLPPHVPSYKSPCSGFSQLINLHGNSAKHFCNSDVRRREDKQECEQYWMPTKTGRSARCVHTLVDGSSSCLAMEVDCQP